MSKFTRVLRPAWARWPALLLWAVARAAAQPPADDFRQSCFSCHTIGGGRLTGPDLKGVTERRDRDWLVRFVTNPKAVIDAGDPLAKQLLAESNNVVMPTIAGLTPARINALLDLIAAESAKPKSDFVGLQIGDQPFTPTDVERGRQLFTGAAKFAGGAPPCLTCHTLRGLQGFGGGRLGPDLTRVYERIQGRKALAAWLVSPASPTMQPVLAGRALTNEEIVPLVAFIEAAGAAGGVADTTGLLNFFLLGLGGAVVGLVLCDALWRRRFRAVRRPLVDRAALKGTR